MLSIFNNLSLSARIAVLALIPLCAVVGVGISDLLKEREKARVAQSVADVVALAPVVSGLVHELQKERGTSAGFIGSKGAKFADSIGQRRADTDRALKAFRASIPEAIGRLDFSGFKVPFDKAVSELDNLDSVRANVDSFSINVPKMAGYYTPLIAELLNMVESVALTSDDGRVVRLMVSYIAFLQAKERAGLKGLWAQMALVQDDLPSRSIANSSGWKRCSAHSCPYLIVLGTSKPKRRGARC